MRSTITIIVLILVGMTVAAIYFAPNKTHDGKTPLTWLSASVPAREDQVKQFNKLNPDLKLSIDPANQGVTKVVVQCSAHMGGDIIDFICDDNIQTYHDAGILMDLTDKAKEMGFSPDTLPDSVKPLVMVKELNKNGKLVDRQYTYPLNIFHLYIIYNKNLFDKYGIPYPSEDLTWEEYIRLAKKLTICQEGEKVPEIFGGMGADFSVILWEMGGCIMNQDGTRCKMDSKAAIKAMIFYHDLYFKEGVEPPPAIKAGIVSSQGGNAASYNLLGNGKLAMAWGARWYLMMLRPYIEQQRELKEKWIKEHPGEKYTGPEPIRWGACHVPRFKGGKRYVTTGGRTAGINGQSKNRDKALRFLKYAAEKEYNLSMCDIADCKPPNKKYYSTKYFYHKDYPGEKEVHDMCMKAVPYGRVTPRSLFVNQAVVKRELKKALDKVQSDASLTDKQIAGLCRTVANRINTRIRTNIERSPQRQKLYKALLKQDGEPIVGPPLDIK